ncbi:hypothetical protein DB35_20405 [Streptomyces abyssalis]|uniref:Uncharacterized protein n=1 Tax=Streptomyces abyssalis TaxID=933944 RepID=A0A1E7JUQ8_9ACTN|nr:DUF6084 family protein [Streptomyces abyssalis]OEU89336.1 hypothetical protein DB35_20405 [Streptomyces abyssalis]OEU93691.1 hypothetical protein AN215_02650 [Streptomyces abyssalis]
MNAEAHTAADAHHAGDAGTGDGRRTEVPDLDFTVTGVRAMPDSAVPTLAFRIALSRTGGGRVRSVSLNTDVRIAVAHRGYESADRLVMARLFGQPEQWATSMRPLAWARISTVVPAFDERTETDLPVPCSRDMELAVTSYFHGVRDGEIPLDLLFSGTVFHDGPDGRLRTAQISWTKDAVCRMPASLWHEVTGRYGGGTSWLPLSPGAYGELTAHRDRHALTGWDETVADLLDRARTIAGGTAWTP